MAHNYAVRDNCGADNTTLCSVYYTVPPATPGFAGACPPPVAGLQCWDEVPSPAEAQLVMESAFPGAVATYIGATTVNNYCQFTVQYAFSVDGPCVGRIICTLAYTGQDLTPPAGNGPAGLSGLACQADVPAPDPAGVAAGFSDNCSSAYAYLINTLAEGDDCGAFSVTYRYHVSDDCDNFVVWETTHTGITTAPRPQNPGPQQGTDTGLLEDGDELDMRVYPNPTAGELFIGFYNIRGEQAELAVYNIYGKRLLNRTLVLDEPYCRLNLAEEGLANGSYLVTVRTDTKTITRVVALSRF